MDIEVVDEVCASSASSMEVGLHVPVPAPTFVPSAQPRQLAADDLHGIGRAIEIDTQSVGEGVRFVQHGQVIGMQMVDDRLRLLPLFIRVAWKGQTHIADLQ